MDGVSEETAKRVLKVAPSYDLRLNELGQYRFQLFRSYGGRWKVVPRTATREAILRGYHEALRHVAGQGLYEVVRKDYWWPQLRVDCLICAKQCPGCRSERARFDR